MLKHSLEGGNMWDIRFSYNIFKQNKFCVTPIVSKTVNDGFTDEGTHCNVYNRFKVVFDESAKTDFLFPAEVKENNFFSNQVYAYYSFFARIKGRILTKYYARQKQFSLTFLLVNIGNISTHQHCQIYYPKLARLINLFFI
jgi:hypothetical protein